MTNGVWWSKYNENYLRLIRDSKSTEKPHIFINNGIVEFVSKQIVEAKKQYYIEGSDFMTDTMYDTFESILKQHDPLHPLLHIVGTGGSL